MLKVLAGDCAGFTVSNDSLKATDSGLVVHTAHPDNCDVKGYLQKFTFFTIIIRSVLLFVP